MRTGGQFFAIWCVLVQTEAFLVNRHKIAKGRDILIGIGQNCFKKLFKLICNLSDGRLINAIGVKLPDQFCS